MEQILSQAMSTSIYWAPALIGGLVDYANQVMRGDKKWSLTGFCVHIGSAMFFGWIAGMAAQGLDHKPGMIGAAGGMGGFLGVRLADLAIYSVAKIAKPKRPNAK